MAEHPAGIEELIGKTTHLVSEVMSEHTKVQYCKVAPIPYQLAFGCGCPWDRITFLSKVASMGQRQLSREGASVSPKQPGNGHTAR